MLFEHFFVLPKHSKVLFRRDDTSDGDEHPLDAVRDVTAGAAAQTYLLPFMEEFFCTCDCGDAKMPARGEAFPRWAAILDLGWRCMRQSDRLVDRAAADLQAAERLHSRHPDRARRRLVAASVALRKADRLRGRTFEAVWFGDRECPPDQMPLRDHASIHAFWDGMRVFARLDQVWEQVRQAIAVLDAEGVDDGRSRIPSWPPVRRRDALRRGSLIARDRILALLKRRERSKAAAPEDAPRKASRGRAPPALAA